MICAKTKMLGIYGIIFSGVAIVLFGLLLLCPIVMVLALTLGDSPHDVDLAFMEYLSLLDPVIGDD